jgi:uncharacterized membrane protein
MMAGMSIADFITQKIFWKQYAVNRQEGLSIFNAAAGFQSFLAIGAVLLLITGVGMMALTHGVFGEQLWMKIKIGLVVLIIVNGPIVGRMQVQKLKHLLMGENQSPGVLARIMEMKRRINLISVLNLMFLASIVVLSVCKFN